MSDTSRENGWQRWAPDDLGQNFSTLEAEMITPIQPDEVSEEDWQAELLRLRHQAEQKGFADGQKKGLEAGHQQGYAAGVEEGKQAGIEQGRAAAAVEQRAVTDRFNGMLQEFTATMSGLNTVIPARLMQIALTAARQVIGHTMMPNNNILMEHIQQLLREETLFGSTPKLWINPQDLDFIQKHLGEPLQNQGWRLLSDGLIKPGGFRISTDDSELDATLDTRWTNLCKRLQEESQS